MLFRFFKTLFVNNSVLTVVNEHIFHYLNVVKIRQVYYLTNNDVHDELGSKMIFVGIH